MWIEYECNLKGKVPTVYPHALTALPIERVAIIIKSFQSLYFSKSDPF